MAACKNICRGFGTGLSSASLAASARHCLRMHLLAMQGRATGHCSLCASFFSAGTPGKGLAAGSLLAARRPWWQAAGFKVSAPCHWKEGRDPGAASLLYSEGHPREELPATWHSGRGQPGEQSWAARRGPRSPPAGAFPSQRKL